MPRRSAHLTRRHFQGPLLVRARLWWRTRRQGALLLAPFRVTGRAAPDALSRITIGAGTRIGQFAWFSLVTDAARIAIGTDCTLSASLAISTAGSVTIGDGTSIGERCFISDHGHDHWSYLEPAIEGQAPPRFGWEKSDPRPVVIGDGVHIGVNVVISPGVSIGDGAVIGANSVVTKSVAPYTVNVGQPAREVRRFEGPRAD
jgi:acetyltransferase-like isoleucine patch superfamily enzyme